MAAGCHSLHSSGLTCILHFLLHCRFLDGSVLCLCMQTLTRMPNRSCCSLPTTSFYEEEKRAQKMNMKVSHMREEKSLSESHLWKQTLFYVVVFVVSV